MTTDCDHYLLICDCDCGCDNTAEWHDEPRCACRIVNCPCIVGEIQNICGTDSCPKCYYHMLMNPTEREKKQFEKNVYARLIYIWDASKHQPVSEIVYPGDPRYETGSRTTKGVKPAHE